MKTVTTINLLTSAQYYTLITGGFKTSVNRVAVNEIHNYVGQSVLFNCDQMLFIVVDQNGKALTGEDVVCLVGE